MSVRPPRSPWSRRLALLAMPLIVATTDGCFPYLETVRPDVRGRVTTSAGAPLAKAAVVACSRRWGQSSETCEHPTRTSADDDGVFVLDQQKALDWCCLGEAPRWRTRVVACDGEHRTAIVEVEGGPPPGGLNLVVDDTLGCREPDDAGP